MTALNPQWPIPLLGPLFDGECVRVGWPDADELDAITALRNRPDVRRQFLDPRPLDRQRNREWLQHGMKRPEEAVLAIRLKADGVFVGTIGWSHGDPQAGSIEIGRLMVDTRVLRAYRDVLPRDYAGVAVDASIGLLDFVFTVLNVRLAYTVVMAGNALALRTNREAGGRIVRTSIERRADGSDVQLIHLECNRDYWTRRRNPVDMASAAAATAAPA